MNKWHEKIDKLSPMYFHVTNELKKYFKEENIEYSINSSNNIELFEIDDYKNINNEITNILDINPIKIDNIEILWNKNLILRLPDWENLNIFCNLSFIENIKDIIKRLIKK